MPLFRHVCIQIRRINEALVDDSRQHNNANATTAPGADPTTATGAGTYDSRVNERVGPLGTGTGPTMNPAQPAPVGRHGNNALAGHGAYQQGMTNLPPERYNNQVRSLPKVFVSTAGVDRLCRLALQAIRTRTRLGTTALHLSATSVAARGLARRARRRERWSASLARYYVTRP